jgi:hypothetical protein
VKRVTLVAAVLASLWFAPGAFAAGWCGAGESQTDRPDTVTGEQVHLVYAVPADGADNFAAVANRMADDMTSIATWWTGQDASRAPRFDLATFPAGTCVDISSVRLPDSSGSLVGGSAAFQRVANDLITSGFGSDFKRYVIYYDGPPVEPNVCGTGAGDFGHGLGFAIVWLAGCSNAPSDAVAAHELVHALGAVPAGAPHECPPPNEMHVCDSTLDLMYWLDSGQPLATRFLDINHDDYYEHPTNGIDIRNSLWLRHLDTPQQPFSAAISGIGSVVSDVPGVACAAACTTLWDQGAAFQLFPVPGGGQRFVRWAGACTGDGACSLLMSQPQAVTAVFGPERIDLKLTTAGRGRVACAPSCTRRFKAGEALTLKAVPAKGWTFSRWSGGCKGTRPVCKPATDFALTVRATFRRR